MTPIDFLAKLVVLCDFDGTITEIDTVEFLLDRFAAGNWRIFDRQFEIGKISLEETLESELSLVKASHDKILKELEGVVTFRPHFKELVKYCFTKHVPFKIVSAGLDFVISHFLESKDMLKYVELYAPKTEFSNGAIRLTFPKLFYETSINFKHDLVKYYRNHSKIVIYIGNGMGDFDAAANADYSFAVKNSKLEKMCQERNIECRSILDFQEVVKAIKDMTHDVSF
jgi:2,3-diketo-5-methylthio-1-phosphopentane phosphatase